MSAEAVKLDVIKLWSSVFLEKDLPEHEAHTRRLIALAGERSREGVFAIRDASVAWLKDHVAQAIEAYLHRTGYARVPAWGGSGRFETLERGDYRPLANQSGADLVGMYVLQWPTGEDATGARDDALPGCFSFYDPRVGMNMNAIRRDPYHDYHRHLIPRVGLLVIWPAYVSYFVHPIPSRKPAMRVAFDIQLQSPRSE